MQCSEESTDWKIIIPPRGKKGSGERTRKKREEAGEEGSAIYGFSDGVMAIYLERRWSCIVVIGCMDAKFVNFISCSLASSSVGSSSRTGLFAVRTEHLR